MKNMLMGLVLLATISSSAFAEEGKKDRKDKKAKEENCEKKCEKSAENPRCCMKKAQA